MARPSNAFDLLGEESPEVGSLLSIVEEPGSVAAFRTAEKKRREEAKEAEKRLEEEEERASMARRLENRRKWFEIQEHKKRLVKVSIKSTLLGLLAPPPRRFSRSSSPHEFQRRGPAHKQGQVGGVTRTDHVPKSTPSTPSRTPSVVSDIGSVSGYSCSTTTTTKPGSSDQTTKATEIGSCTVKPSMVPASPRSVLPTSTNGPAVKANTASPSPSKIEATAKFDVPAVIADTTVLPTSTTPSSISSSDQIQESKIAGANDNGTNSEGWQLVAPRRRMKQGGRTYQKAVVKENKEGKHVKKVDARNSAAQEHSQHTRVPIVKESDNRGQSLNNEGRRFTNGGQKFNNEGRRFNNGGQRFNRPRRIRDGEQGTKVEPKPKPGAQFSLNSDQFPALSYKKSADTKLV